MLQLLPRQLLVRTGEFDHADWNYRPLLGAIQRRRFRLVLDLLGTQRYGRLLEVGYGSGVFLPTLARRCDELYALDVHDRQDDVARALAQVGLQVRQFSGSVTATPFAPAFFDAVVSVSAMEYVQEIEQACTELRRILVPGGILIVVTPGHSVLIDAALRVLTDEDPDRNYGGRRGRLEKTLRRHFHCERTVCVPRLGGRLVRLYTAMRLVAERSS